MASERGFTDAALPTREYSAGRSALYGALAGIVAGIIFGMMMVMVMPGTMEMIGSIITRQPDLVLGWIYHLFNSALIGAIFGLVVALAKVSLSYGTGALWGAVYGFIWWILGPLILMPLLLGMTHMVFAINNDTLMSLVGHLVYGVLTGVGYVFLRDRFARQ
ncbi:MAG TPA: hypothetical protein VFR15_10325 [Chloroflexia bacterium]|nr:hypothetical protein [Chloroflexia bacterium]